MLGWNFSMGAKGIVNWLSIWNNSSLLKRVSVCTKWEKTVNSKFSNVDKVLFPSIFCYFVLRFISYCRMRKPRSYCGKCYSLYIREWCQHLSNFRTNESFTRSGKNWFLRVSVPIFVSIQYVKRIWTPRHLRIPQKGRKHRRVINLGKWSILTSQRSSETSRGRVGIAAKVPKDVFFV